LRVVIGSLSSFRTTRYLQTIFEALRLTVQEKRAFEELLFRCNHALAKGKKIQKKGQQQKKSKPIIVIFM